jgi:hypothetical protein
VTAPPRRFWAGWGVDYRVAGNPPVGTPSTALRTPRPLLWLGVVVVVIAASAAHLVARSGTTLGWPRQRFSQDAWASAPPEARYVFFKDLRDREVLAGMSRQEVLNLLGTKDQTAPVGAPYLSYVVKYRDENEYSFNAIYILQIELGPDSRVARVFERAK